MIGYQSDNEAKSQGQYMCPHNNGRLKINLIALESSSMDILATESGDLLQTEQGVFTGFA